MKDAVIKKAYLKLGEIEKLEILVIIRNKLKIFHYFSLFKDIRLINERKIISATLHLYGKKNLRTI